ncbi:conserved protein, unknown function [Hepatocystis sp. ex Piliocolobus tephrosceles]|nr:conserved protein, unknown function [Hepatocystis sp. ex Piliocolobus tephrosceles]
MSDTFRRGFLFGIFAILIFISFAAVDSQKFMWIVLSSCSFILLIIDFIFCGADKFIYDPFYSNWEQKQAQD